MVNLQQLLQAISVVETYKEENISITGLSYHSQKVESGHLFVCIKGYKTDGHKYLADAVKNGAIAAVVEDFQEGIDIPQYRVENSRIALAQLGNAYFNEPSKKLKMIGITATNGKTTTSYMTNAMLETEGYKTGLIGTVTVKIDDYSFPAELTTPESLDLQNYLHQMVERGVTHVSMEVSSAAMETNRVETVEYDIVTLNNISREHIDSHGSFEQYWNVKSSLITNASENSVAVLNLDDEYSASLINRTNASVVTFGVRNEEGHIRCKNLDLSTGRGKFTYEIVKEFKSKSAHLTPCSFEVELAVPGLHSVYNSMVAITVALLNNVSIASIQETLQTFTGVERRFEFIFEEDIKIVDDHFANPGNINITLKTLQYMDFQNLHLVYAIRGERGPTVNRENAEAIVEWASKLNISEIIATKSVSHVTLKDRVTDEEVKAFMDVMEKAGIEVKLYDELPDAITEAITNVVENDLILLAGAQGMDLGGEIALEIIHKRTSKAPKTVGHLQ
ncbi:Mur ligase family protein [Sutcliffiella cohnii]|uniref:UDP-N-acetylmuramyl peptide synthase n=1 Tax=Sutcliffiella cohnii TaxID=33932 RepID=A0A223KWM4_9BACI|nr:UDP-N-acetylmuramyl-tripeptide synthetase [Sutcliffiella cohnii]AST93861.1 UDP-N-acetylmuramyl peptide synthase [Sutcliffiella cohnii]MED4015808.1 UDP-N-acetylmuramyl-tripeptide synthetase [Sutcliffiella cohnii]